MPILFLASSLAFGGSKSASALFQEGQKEERAGHAERAYQLYFEAATKDDTHPEYWAKAMALRPRLNAGVRGSLSDTASAAKPIDPALLGTITDRDLADARRPLPPTDLKASPVHKDFDLRGDAKTLFEKVADAFNLLVVFDSNFQPGPTVRFQLTDADYKVALYALQSATNSFVVPAGDRLLLVANDTPQRRQELESTAAVVIPTPEAFGVQDLQEIATAVRSTLDITRLVVDNQKQMVLIRDRISKVRLAEKLFRDLLQPRTKVAIEVQLLSMDESSSLKYGLGLPTSFPLVSLGNLPKYLVQAIPTGALLTFGGGASLLGLGITDSSFFATVTKSRSTSLMESEIVTLDGQPATLHVGDKYPIPSNVYTVSTGASGQGFTPPATFTFEDLGLIIKITPHVHGMEGMTLDVEAEVKLLGAGAVNGIPVISSRKFQSKVNLVEGQWAIVAGLLGNSEATMISGMPGLHLIPLLHTTQHDRTRNDSLIVLKPHLLSIPSSEQPIPNAWVGTETRPRPL
ncbi:MAG: type II and III secretion system protein [Acidobacteriota bacterium]|nr:type II and III secretion system protein [Acidobacteriota bacterium]